MNQVRIHGDPFGEAPHQGLLRSFLRLLLGNGLEAAVSLSAVAARAAEPGEWEVPLTDGVRNLRLGTRLPPAEVELLLRAAGTAVASTAPVVVFAAPEAVADAMLTAGLEWPESAIVLAAKPGHMASDLLERVRAELRWAGVEDPAGSLPLRALQSWSALPPPGADGPFVHVGCDEADGTDLVVRTWAEHFADSPHGLRLVVGALPAEARERLQASLGELAARVELVAASFEPAHVRDAAAIVLPWRQARCPKVLVQALASARPVVASRWQATAAQLGRLGVCHPVGGRLVSAEGERPAHFEPHPRALLAAMKAAVGDAATGRRGRQHVGETLTAGRTTPPPPPLVELRTPRPAVVLEAPFFEVSSSAELSIATARALVARGDVEVRLVPTAPLRGAVQALRERAPELLPLLTRSPGTPDLWLSSGWPARSRRPACRSWAIRLDQEYGALPLELTPHVSQEADRVIVHSEYVYRMVLAAGRPMGEVTVIPHGVDAAMHEHATPDPRVLAWKGNLPAVLFCGGLIWRKGFDVFLRAVLDAHARGARFAVVVKTVGHDQHYGRFHLGDLVQRFRNTPGTPPLLLVEDDLGRDELAGLYAACDVMLQPFRGEGFCLPLLEARACGLPVLATAGGAPEPFLAGPGAVKIPSARRAVELPMPHLSMPWVMEPSPDDAGRLLAETLADLPARRTAARGFAAAVRAAYPWSAAAESLAQLAWQAFGTRRLPVMPVPAAEPIVTLPTAPKVVNEPVASR